MKKILTLVLFVACLNLTGQTTKKFTDYPVVTSASSGSLLLIRSGASGNTISTITSTNLLSGAMIYPGAGIPLSTGSAWGTSITNNSANWNTAYGWGNHASAGYSTTSHTDVVVDGDFTSQGIMLRGASSGTYSILTNASTNWNTAYGWGNHASAGYALQTQVTSIVNDTVQIVGLSLPYLKLTPSADPPAGASEGMIYADTDHHLYYYNGSSWVQVDNE